MSDSVAKRSGGETPSAPTSGASDMAYGQQPSVGTSENAYLERLARQAAARASEVAEDESQSSVAERASAMLTRRCVE